MKPPTIAPRVRPFAIVARVHRTTLRRSVWSKPLACNRKSLRIARRMRRCADDRSHAGVAACASSTEVGPLKLLLPDELNMTPDLGCGGRSTRYPGFAT